MKITSVEEYIESLNENGQKYVNEFILFMKQEYPNLNNKICFSMPMWLLNKKMNEGYIAISAAKSHFSIHFSDENFVSELGEKLNSCKTGKRCINIKYDDDTSFQIVKDNVKEFLNNRINCNLS